MSEQAMAPGGSPEEEYRHLSQEAALVERSWADRLELTGADRQRFLSGLVSCDLKALTPGQGVYGFFPDVHGKILADGVFLAREDRLWVELPAGKAGEIADHLGRYLIADRVEIHPREDLRLLSVVGPAAEARLGSLAELPAAAYDHRRAVIDGAEVLLVRQPLAGTDAFTLWAGADGAERLLRALTAGLGLPRAGREALERLRIERGVPAFGQDFGSDHFPQESGREAEGVSYSKGCYLGQEVIARIHYRGKANRAARRLLFAGAAPPAPGSPLLLDGQEVGRVGSATAAGVTSGRGSAVGIAVLHRRGWEPGTTLEIEGGGTAEVALLPGEAPLPREVPD